jgi:hypothetical protein
MPIDTTADVLATLEEQGARDADEVIRNVARSLILAARGHLTAESNVRVSEYAPQRQRRELDALQQQIGSRIRNAEAEALAALDHAEAEAVADDDNDRVVRAREGRRLSDVVDLTTLRAPETSVVEILRLVEDADRFGLGAQARDIAIPALRKRAADELRRHVVPTRGTAGAALVMLTVSQPTGRRDVRAPFDAKRRRVRELTMEVARVLGLSEQLKRAAVSPALTDAPKARSTMVIGSFWDRHPQFQK